MVDSYTTKLQKVVDVVQLLHPDLDRRLCLVLVKARSHKYLKRTGTSSHYKYTYAVPKPSGLVGAITEADWKSIDSLPEYNGIHSFYTSLSIDKRPHTFLDLVNLWETHLGLNNDDKDVI